MNFRIKVYEGLPSGLMVTRYCADRPGESGKVGYIAPHPVKPTRPGGSWSA